MLRSRVRVLIVCAVLSAMAVPQPRPAAPPAPAPGDPSRLLDSLFFAARYDTILQLLPALLGNARASGDSVLLGRLVAQEGRVHLARGNRAEAERLIDAALRISESVRDTVNWMPTLNYQGFVLVGQGRYDEAVPYYEKRMELARLVKSPGDEAWGWSSIAYVHQMKGDLPRARDEYLRAVSLFREAGLPRQELTPLLGLGQVLGSLGDVQGRKECYQRAWIVARDVGDPVNEMWAANNLGFIEFGSGDMGRALAYYRRAYDIGIATGFARGRIQPAVNYALASAYAGRVARAESVLVEARRVCETSGNTEFLENVEVAIALVRNAKGEHHAAAALCREILRRPGVERVYRDHAAITLANALGHMDSLAGAADVLTGHFDAPGAVISSENAPDASLLLAEIYQALGDAQAGLARAVVAARQAEAQGWKRQAVNARFIESALRRRLGDGSGALVAFHAALDSLSAYRDGIGRPEWREAFGSRIADNVVDAARCVLEFPDSLPADLRERAFFDVIQRVKARTLIERIAEPRFGSAGLADRVGPAVLTLHDLQSRVLRDGEVFLDFVVGNDASFLFAVTPGDMRLVLLPGANSPLAQRAALLRDIVSDPGADVRAEYPPERMEAVARPLARDILGPVADRIRAARRVIVSPDGFFASVPIAVLALDTEDGRSVPLVESHEIVMVPCASVLASARSRDYAPADEASVVAMTGATGDLPGARREAMDLRRRFQHVQVVSGIADAAAFADAANRANVLHIAAHARVNDEAPWESGFWLGADPPAARAGSSGLLTPADSAEVARAFSAQPTLAAWQIAAASLTNDVAVLAGCETGGGRITRGEGVLGLTAAFLSAGVPVVVSAAWPVDDRVTAEFMRRFYRHLSASAPVSEALRRAQIELRARAEFAHPFYWAGFAVTGDGARGVPVRRKGQVRWPLVLAGVGVVAGVLVVWSRSRRRGYVAA